MKDSVSAGMEKGARVLVDTNARVGEGEAVVITTDPTMLAFAEAVAAAARARKAAVTLCVMPARSEDGQEPPSSVAAAMEKADVIFSPVSVSITHTRAMRRALDAGARAILMTAYTPALMESPALLKTDFAAQAEVCRRVGRAFTEGSHVRLTSPSGTDMAFSIEGRAANVLTNVPEPGELAPVPDIEVNVVPVTGSARGNLVADASIPYLGIGVLEEPVTCTIEEGSVTRIEGGSQAEVLRAALQRHANRNCYNVAELGLGLNPNASLSGDMLDDEGVLGTIHIGIGTSFTLGGEVMAPTHYDLLMWEPTVAVDGRVIQRNREILA